MLIGSPVSSSCAATRRDRKRRSHGHRRIRLPVGVPVAFSPPPVTVARSTPSPTDVLALQKLISKEVKRTARQHCIRNCLLGQLCGFVITVTLSLLLALCIDFDRTSAFLIALYETLVGKGYEKVTFTRAQKCAVLFAAEHDCCRFYYNLVCLESQAINVLDPCVGYVLNQTFFDLCLK